jgi:hypothetical protein
MRTVKALGSWHGIWTSRAAPTAPSSKNEELIDRNGTQTRHQPCPRLARGTGPARSAPIGSSYGIPGDAVYDYVVVGAGNVGAPVAHRLGGAGHTVALVEAGSL